MDHWNEAVNSLKSIEDSNGISSDMTKGIVRTWILKNWNRVRNFLTGKAQREPGQRVKTDMAGVRPRSKGGKTAHRPTQGPRFKAYTKFPTTRTVEDIKRLKNRKRIVEKLKEIGEDRTFWE